MEITPGIRRCSFGYGEIVLTSEQIAALTADEALVALGTRIDDIQTECEAVTSHYQCKCQLSDLMECVRMRRKELGNRGLV